MESIAAKAWPVALSLGLDIVKATAKPALARALVITVLVALAIKVAIIIRTG